MSETVSVNLSQEQREEHEHFLSRIVETYRENIIALTPPLLKVGVDYEVDQFEDAVSTREQFRCWGQADLPFTREDVALLHELASHENWQDSRVGCGEELRSLADRIEALLPPKETSAPPPSGKASSSQGGE